MSGPPGFNCWTSVAPAFQSWFAVEYSSCLMNLDLYVRCFYSLMSRGPSRGPKIFYVYMNHSRTYGEVAAAYDRFKSPSNLLLTVPRRCFCCGVFLIVNVRPLSVARFLTYCSIYLGLPSGHLLGKGCPLGFSLVLFLF